jgi:hypothetical protein
MTNCTEVDFVRFQSSWEDSSEEFELELSQSFEDSDDLKLIEDDFADFKYALLSCLAIAYLCRRFSNAHVGDKNRTANNNNSMKKRRITLEDFPSRKSSDDFEVQPVQGKAGEILNGVLVSFFFSNYLIFSENRRRRLSGWRG